MKFSRVNESTVQCIITEDEILELGYTMDELLSNGTRTQEFMNHIMELAEEEVDFKRGNGMKTVRADIRSDHTVSLLISDRNISTEDGVKNFVKDVVSELMKQMPKPAELAAKAAKPEVIPSIVALFAFEDLDTLMRYAKQVKEDTLPENKLYKFEDCYFLIMDMTACTEVQVRRLSALTDEYSADVFVGTEKRAFIEEHGQLILAEYALEQLRTI